MRFAEETTSYLALISYNMLRSLKTRLENQRCVLAAAAGVGHARLRCGPVSHCPPHTRKEELCRELDKSPCADLKVLFAFLSRIGTYSRWCVGEVTLFAPPARGHRRHVCKSPSDWLLRLVRRVSISRRAAATRRRPARPPRARMFTWLCW
eukprot:365578-Chlamydomonas_euryale.AAC.13